MFLKACVKMNTEVKKKQNPNALLNGQPTKYGLGFS